MSINGIGKPPPPGAPREQAEQNEAPDGPASRLTSLAQARAVALRELPAAGPLGGRSALTGEAARSWFVREYGRHTLDLVLARRASRQARDASGEQKD